MNWFSKVKNWFKGLIGKKEEVKVVPVEAVHVPTVVVEVPIKKEETELSKKAKEVRALGPSDLIREIPIKRECDHILTFKKQTWVRVSDKKFELQNEMMCTKCTSHKILPIG